MRIREIRTFQVNEPPYYVAGYGALAVNVFMFPFLMILLFVPVGHSSAEAPPSPSVELFEVVSENEECVNDFPVSARLKWQVVSDVEFAIEVRVNSPDGTLFSSGGLRGESVSGKWVNETTEFFLVRVDSGEILTSSLLSTPTCADKRQALLMTEGVEQLDAKGEAAVYFSTVPGRLVYCGQPVDRTSVVVHWNVSDVYANEVQIFIESVDGNLFYSGGAFGEASTGKWVRDGLVFVLYLPEIDRVVASHKFRILPCSAGSDP